VLVKFAGKIESILVGQVSFFLDDRGERMEGIAREAKPDLIDHLHG
jgi:hypothetical protein